MRISRALPFLLVLGLALRAAPVQADDAKAATAACLAAVQAENDEASSWSTKSIEALSDTELLNSVPLHVAEQNAELRKLCGDPASKVTPKETEEFVTKFNKMGALAAKMLERERVCRGNPKCMAARVQKAEDDAAERQFAAGVVLPLCEATWGLENERAIIAQERANPSGVVSLADLHSAGSAVQYYQSQIAAGGHAYAAHRHHPFKGWMTENVCLASYDASMVERGCTRVDLSGGMHSWNCGQ